MTDITSITLKQRQAAVVSDSRVINVLGLPVREGLPAPNVPYVLSDPFILVHEGRFRARDLAGRDLSHPHRGFDNLWYALKGTISTGHSTGAGGAMERAQLPEGGLLVVRTGRGVVHAEALGADEVAENTADSEFHGVLFWVNLARKDKMAEPKARIVVPQEMPLRQERDTTVRVLVGEGSPAQLGTPALILDVVLKGDGEALHEVPAGYQGFAYMLEGGASFGLNRARAHAGQLVLMGEGDSLAVRDAEPGTRYLLMAGRPYGEVPRFNGPFVD